MRLYSGPPLGTLGFCLNLVPVNRMVAWNRRRWRCGTPAERTVSKRYLPEVPSLEGDRSARHTDLSQTSSEPMPGWHGQGPQGASPAGGSTFPGGPWPWCLPRLDAVKDRPGRSSPGSKLSSARSMTVPSECLSEWSNRSIPTVCHGRGSDPAYVSRLKRHARGSACRSVGWRGLEHRARAPVTGFRICHANGQGCPRVGARGSVGRVRGLAP